jgi:hypothetical protein
MTEKEDKINKPNHYVQGRKFEPIHVIRDWELNFALGNAVKYISRAGRKVEDEYPGSEIRAAIQDLKKAAFYVQDEINALEAALVLADEPKKSYAEEVEDEASSNMADQIKEAIDKEILKLSNPPESIRILTRDGKFETVTPRSDLPGTPELEAGRRFHEILRSIERALPRKLGTPDSRRRHDELIQLRKALLDDNWKSDPSSFANWQEELARKYLHEALLLSPLTDREKEKHATLASQALKDEGIVIDESRKELFPKVSMRRPSMTREEEKALFDEIVEDHLNLIKAQREAWKQRRIEAALEQTKEEIDENGGLNYSISAAASPLRCMRSEDPESFEKECQDNANRILLGLRKP